MNNGELLTTFDHQPRTRIVFGAGAALQIGRCAAELDAKTALLVTDPGIVAAGHVAPVRQSLAEAGVTVEQFDTVHANPTTRDVDACLKIAQSQRIDVIIGLGGGSSMDTAKGCNFLLTNGGRMMDYWGVGKAAKPMLPLIAAPTTAGTGSECQSFALIADETTHQKMACGDPKAAASVAVLDPMLTLTQPTPVAVCTGLDALSHALETAVTIKRTPVSRMYAHEAFRLIARYFCTVLADGANIEARSGMMLGAAYAGMAIENSMLGAAHAAANPLTARCGLPHGLAVGVMLPHVMRYNLADQTVKHGYTELAKTISPQTSAAQAADALIEFIVNTLKLAGVAPILAQHGVEESQLPALANEAARQWTAKFNPRSINADGFLALYQDAYN